MQYKERRRSVWHCCASLSIAYFWFHIRSSFLKKFCEDVLNPFVRVIPDVGDLNMFLDLNSSLVISPRFALLCGIRSGSVYRVRFFSGDSSSSVERVLEIVILSLEQKAGIAFITSLCAFNIFRESDKADYFVESITDLSSHLCVANEVKVSLVRSPLYEEIDFSELLEDHFSVPRLLSVGDIIVINSSQEVIGRTVQYLFKIVFLDNVGPEVTLIVDSKHSTLYQVGSICDRIWSPRGDIFIPPCYGELTSRIKSLIFAESSIFPDRPVTFLLSGQPGCGKRLFLRHLAMISNLNILFFNCVELSSDVPATFEARLANAFTQGSHYGHFTVLVFTNFNIIGASSAERNADIRILKFIEQQLVACDSLAVFFTCHSSFVDQLSPFIRSIISYEFILPNLNEADRREILLRIIKQPHSVDIDVVVRLTMGFMLAEINAVVEDAVFKQFEEGSAVLSMNHILWAVDLRNKTLSDEIGVPKIPSTSWDDVGGLNEVKTTICESLEEKFSDVDKHQRTGILMYGPPGCGKTLIAKAVAHHFQACFLSVKGAELLNKYVGESESNVRKVFEKARLAAPSVIFFDEIDAIAPERGRSGDSAGVADRMVSQLVAELDSSDNLKVFVLAATNRLDLIDPSLLCAGRFDKCIKVDVGNDIESKECILRALCRKVCCDKNIDFRRIASLSDKRMSGSDLRAVVCNAVMNIVRTQIETVRTGGKLPEENTPVTEADLEKAMKEFDGRK